MFRRPASGRWPPSAVRTPGLGGVDAASPNAAALNDYVPPVEEIHVPTPFFVSLCMADVL